MLIIKIGKRQTHATKQETHLSQQRKKEEAGYTSTLQNLKA
jgi:hypothetical protein